MNALQEERVPTCFPGEMAHWLLDVHLAGAAVCAWKPKVSDNEAVCVCVAMTVVAGIICVDGLGVPLFIGHVTPWGRTNWWPLFCPRCSQRHRDAVA